MGRKILRSGLVLLLAACASDSGGTPTPRSNVRLIIASGDGQTAAPGVVLDSQLVVRVTDSLGNPLAGKLVSWTSSAGGLVWPDTATTGADGRAAAHWLLGSAAGPQIVTANVAGAATSAPVRATASGTPQYHFAGTADTGLLVTTCLGLSSQLSGPILQDGANHPAAAAPVTWAVAQGHLAESAPAVDGTTTDRFGQLPNIAFTIGNAPETETLVFWGPTVRALQIRVAGVSPCPIFAYAGGAGQVATAGSPLPAPIQIRVSNDSGNVVGRAVIWSVVTGGGSLADAATITSVGGIAAASWTLGSTPGTQSIQATVAGRATPVVVTATALDPTSAPTLVATVPASGATYYHDTFVRDGLAFSFEWNKGVFIYDVGNGMKGGSPGNPQLVSQLITSDDGVPGGPAAHNGWWFQNPVTGEKRYLFVGQEGPLTVGATSSGDIHIVDVSDLANPHEVGFIHMAGAGTHNFWMDEANQVLYAAYYNGGVIKVDVSGTLSGDMSNRIVAQVRPGGPGNTYVWGVMLANGTLYASDMLSGLWALDPATLAIKGGGNVFPAGFASFSDLWVDGTMAYTGSYRGVGAGLAAWSLGQDGVPTLDSQMFIPGGLITSDVAVSPNHKMLVVTIEQGSSNGLYVYDRVDPLHPQLRGRYIVPEGLHTGEVKEVNGRTYVFAARDPNQQSLMIFDITDVVH